MKCNNGTALMDAPSSVFRMVFCSTKNSDQKPCSILSPTFRCAPFFEIDCVRSYHPTNMYTFHHAKNLSCRILITNKSRYRCLHLHSDSNDFSE